MKPSEATLPSLATKPHSGFLETRGVRSDVHDYAGQSRFSYRKLPIEIHVMDVTSDDSVERAIFAIRSQAGFITEVLAQQVKPLPP